MQQDVSQRDLVYKWPLLTDVAADEDLLSPSDGCYSKWEDEKLGSMGFMCLGADGRAKEFISGRKIELRRKEISFRILGWFKA